MPDRARFIATDMLDRQARFLLLRNSDDRMRGDIRLSDSEILPTPAWGRNNFWPFGEIAEMAEAFDIPNETGTIEASCWRNLWFMRDGRSYRGPFRIQIRARGHRAGESLDGSGEERRGADAGRVHGAARGHNALHPGAGPGAGSVDLIYPQSLGITLGEDVRGGTFGADGQASACYARVLGRLPKLLIFIVLGILPIHYNALRGAVETSAQGL